jgi:2-dehydro-3-deoxyphosphogluconate aldolase/(4S)-4-hydroxy-2-oxoglutarate aldolase
MIPVFYHQDEETAKQVIDVCYQAGLKVFEFTNRGENAFSVFQSLKKHVEQYPDFRLGIGTILETGSAQKYIDAGADFAVSPIVKKDLAEICQQLNTLWIPGCATTTEIALGKELGAIIIKIFPASVLGPQFIASVMPVIPGLELMPTGGIEPSYQELQAWFKAGAVCVGMGSQLFSKDIIARKDWARLRANIATTVTTIQEIKSGK